MRTRKLLCNVLNFNTYELTNNPWSNRFAFFFSFIRKFSYLVLFISISHLSFGQKSATSVADLKKKAEKLFNDEKYDEALQSYSRLLSLEPQSPVYNYRYGVCLLFSGQDKTQSSGYLEAAAKSPTIKSQVHFYLGRSYMYRGHYNEAIAQFEEFIKTNPSKALKEDAEQFISNCHNANELKKDRRNITIVSQQEVSRNSFFSKFDFSDASGKILAALDKFLTPIDKSKRNDPTMFMTNDGHTIYYASYGKKADHGKDLYKITKLSAFQWSEPINLGDKINTAENEDYPYIDKDGKTLYFCSKGHNSIGGYVIFKSVYDFSRDEWSEPVNIGIPINTTDDDILYVPNSTGDQATYATAIESAHEKIQIRNIRLGDIASDVAVIRGIYVSQDQAMRHDARLTVINNSNNGVVTSIHTNPKTGEYEIILPPGEDYMLVVEGGSYLPHAETFALPKLVPGLALKQKVLMNKNANTEKMTLSNFFNIPLATNKTQTEAPTEVKSSELSTAAIDSSKLKPFTIEGKVVYVPAPAKESGSKTLANSASSKDNSTSESKSNPTLTSSTKEQPNSSLADKKQLPGESKSDLNTKSDSLIAAAPDTKSTAEQNKENPVADVTTKSETENKEAAETNQAAKQDISAGGTVSPDTTQEPVALEVGEQQLTETENDTVAIRPVITEKTSNADLVKLCFKEAYSLKEEANTATVKAMQKREESRKLDSLSKNLAKQAEQLVSSNHELSKQLFSESKDDANQSEVKTNEALVFEMEAKEKNKQAEESLAEANQLMTELKVDTNAVAYHSPSKKLKKAPPPPRRGDNESILNEPFFNPPFGGWGGCTSTLSIL